MDKISVSENSHDSLDSQVLQRQSLTSIYYPESSQSISVSEPRLRSTLFSKHIQYLISGCDSVGKFESYRRYKEFHSLRKTLFTQWPGCAVPQLPPKQKIGNLELTFIETRRKQLEHFLTKITRVPHLYASEEFQLFIRGPKNYHKSAISEKTVNYKLISEKYKTVFSDYVEYKRDGQIETDIATILGHLNNGISNFENLIKLCCEQLGYMNQTMGGVYRLVRGINETKAYLEESIGEFIFKTIDDPFSEMVQWCRNSNLLVSGIIEGIYKQYELQRLKSQILNKIEGEKEKIQQLGKKPSRISKIFRKKPNEFYIGRCESEIEEYNATVQAIQIILDITSALIVFKEYPEFKEFNKVEFSRILNSVSALYEASCGLFNENFRVVLNNSTNL